jgi:predicted DNA-binding helix-hairpin-helix protein
VTLPDGGKSILFKTLLSNACSNDCRYCPLRQQMDVRRCSLSPEETARVFLDYYEQRKVFGLFLSSGVCGSADSAMGRLNAAARILRNKHQFRGYVHLKILPGASDAAIEEAVSLASTVSLNIETPGEAHLEKLSNKKNYIGDIIRPIKLISRLTARGARYERVKQTTQFIVGAAGESDAEIVKYTAGLYERLKMHRVYFSAYQKGLGDESITGEKQTSRRPSDIFAREHRLYQVDFLFRKYGFRESDIIFDENGDLSLTTDPKEAWASRHPEAFPVNVNAASKFSLLRVPGLGPVTVKRILEQRKERRIKRIEEVGKVGIRLKRASKYLSF